MSLSGNRSILAAVAACAMLLAAPTVSASARERTFPLLTTYSTADHNAGAQNFDITEDSRGVIYLANEWGVLEYDGTWWHLFKPPHDATVFAIAVTDDGRVAIGTDNDFGYVGHDTGGRPRYVSLSPLLPKGVRNEGQTVQVVRTAGGIIFITETLILRWDGTRVTVLEKVSRDAQLPRAFEVGGEVWISRQEGVARVAGNTLVPVPEAEAFRGKPVRMIVPAGNGRYLMNVKGEGLTLLTATGVFPFAAEASKRIAADRVSGGMRLDDGRFVIATRGAGIFIVRPDGELDQILDPAVGLPASDVTAARLMSDGALWLSLDDGMVRIDIASAVSMIDNRGGLRGAVEAIVRHRKGLTVGTTSGLFRIGSTQSATAAQSNVATRIGPKVLAGWSLLSTGEELLAGTESGVVLIPDSGDPEPIALPYKCVGYELRSPPERKDLVYVGSDRGLMLLGRDASGWHFRGAVEGVPSPVRNIVVDEGGILWIGSGSGMARVELPHGYDSLEDAKIQTFGDGEVSVHRLAGRIVAFWAGSDRLLALDLRTGKFVPDPVLGGFSNGSEITAATTDAAGNVWLASSPIAVVLRGENGHYTFDDQRLLGVPKMQTDVITAESDGVIWIGSERGLFRFDSTRRTRPSQVHPPLIRRAMAAGAVLPLDDGVEITARAARRIRIELAALSYEGSAKYQYKLEPSDEEWSAWTSEPVIEFTNLWEGTYTLFVRTKRTEGPGTLLAWRFLVLPPWYRTPWAFALWVALVIGMIIAVSRLRTRTLRSRAGMLERRVADQTRELRAAIAQTRVARDALAEKNEALEFANARLQELSFDDALTGIANRRRLEQMLQIEWHHSARQGSSLGLIMLDLDHFKQLNDARGHQEGDESLKRVARFLAASIRRAGDLAARYGGEEFALVLPDTDLTGATHFAEHLRSGVEALRIAHPGVASEILTASFGVASIRPSRDDSPADLIAAADRALYRAKAAGRNCVRTAEIDDQSTKSA